MNITIPFEQWEQTGSEEDITSRLLSGITINGLPLHVEAIAIDPDDDIQKAADPTFEDDVERYQSIQDTNFRTTEINGRQYIIVATPHGD